MNLSSLALAASVAASASSWQVDRAGCFASSRILFGDTVGTVIFTEANRNKSIYVVDIPGWKVPKFTDTLPIEAVFDEAPNSFRGNVSFVTTDRLAFMFDYTDEFKEGFVSSKKLTLRFQGGASIVQFDLGDSERASNEVSRCVYRLLEV